MKGSRMLGIGVVVACLLYFAVAVPDRRHERFPVFAWDLFVAVPSPHQQNYGIRIVSIKGKPLEPPRYFEDASGIVSNPTSVDAFTLTQTIGNALRKDQPAAAKAAEDLLYERFLRDLGAVRYEVVRRRFEIRERARCDCFEDEQVVATVEAG